MMSTWHPGSRVLAIGIKDRDRHFIGDEEYET
jgi:hypothetical protein